MKLAPLAILLAVAPLACSSTKEVKGNTQKDPYGTVTDFCRAWAEATCNQNVVDACAAESIDACSARQRSFCSSNISSSRYSSDTAEECLEAVEAAYEDAKLTLEERELVVELSGACDKINSGTGADGDACSSDSDCNRLEELECVKSPGSASGVCTIPQVVGGGFACGQPSQICEDGFYCDGNNCLAGRGEGVDCAPETPCGSGLYCDGSGGSSTCRAKESSGSTCVSDVECSSGLCVLSGSAGVCSASIILAPSESICQNLR